MQCVFKHFWPSNMGSIWTTFDAQSFVKGNIYSERTAAAWDKRLPHFQPKSFILQPNKAFLTQLMILVANTGIGCFLENPFACLDLLHVAQRQRRPRTDGSHSHLNGSTCVVKRIDFGERTLRNRFLTSKRQWIHLRMTVLRSEVLFQTEPAGVALTSFPACLPHSGWL